MEQRTRREQVQQTVDVGRTVRLRRENEEQELVDNRKYAESEHTVAKSGAEQPP